MVNKMQKVEVLQGFCTDDRWGPVNANRGDIIDLTESLAVRLTKQGLVKKYRKPAKKRGK
jgi:hypothetical protein